MKRISKKEQRRREFKDSLYQTLRDFQDGKVKGEGQAAGRLSQPLTVVFDRILADAEKLTASVGAARPR